MERDQVAASDVTGLVAEAVDVDCDVDMDVDVAAADKVGAEEGGDDA